MHNLMHNSPLHGASPAIRPTASTILQDAADALSGNELIEAIAVSLSKRNDFDPEKLEALGNTISRAAWDLSRG